MVTVENNFVLERPPHSEEEEEDTDELDGDIEDGHCLESEGIAISFVLLKFTLVIFWGRKVLPINANILLINPEKLYFSGPWTLLPDGTQQVLNLLDAICDILKKNGDNLGLQTVKSMFG